MTYQMVFGLFVNLPIAKFILKMIVICWMMMDSRLSMGSYIVSKSKIV